MGPSSSSPSSSSSSSSSSPSSSSCRCCRHGRGVYWVPFVAMMLVGVAVISTNLHMTSYKAYHMYAGGGGSGAAWSAWWSTHSPSPSPFVSPSPSPSAPLLFPPYSALTPAIREYLDWHSEAALRSRGVLSSRRVCVHPVLISCDGGCGGGNWGTNMFRLLFSVKLGIMLNRTVVIRGPQHFVNVRWLLRWDALVSARERVGCPYHHDSETRYLELGNPQPFGDVFLHLTHHWTHHNCTHLRVPESSSDPSVRGRLSVAWSGYRMLRCDDIYSNSSSNVFASPYVDVRLGDQWQALALLEQNPYYRAKHNLPPHPFNQQPHQHQQTNETDTHTHAPSHTNPNNANNINPALADLCCELFRGVVGLDDDVAEVVRTVTQGRPFDYYVHIRSVRGGTIEQLFPYILQQLLDQWAKWNHTHMHMHKHTPHPKHRESQHNTPGERPVSVSVSASPPPLPLPPPPSASASSAPPSPPPHPPRRLWLLLDYGNRTEFCAKFEQALPWLSCSYLSLPEYPVRYGRPLPESLSETLVHRLASEQGWGTLPSWANVVDMFAVSGHEYGWTSQVSAYGRILTFLGQDCSKHRARQYQGGTMPDDPYRLF